MPPTTPHSAGGSPLGLTVAVNTPVASGISDPKPLAVGARRISSVGDASLLRGQPGERGLFAVMARTFRSLVAVRSGIIFAVKIYPQFRYRSVATLSQETHQELKKVHEVEVEAKRAEDGDLLDHVGAPSVGVLFLDLLCVVGDEP